ncbi:tRNA uracil 4-sulfurtransferase ThiI [Caldivirga maquilingensis]|uniref:Probable tRNA sulfurtransferase n=1 Tax=Caldivirga maquilingensis (strain ATCC 700844 / DSM 13496 / JCM 10307 / IC-167) TaxID=397948 RepID=A8M9I7_CALMQ|nr:tRNA uracil 4-sulfurtransferase ThiI [Caldivirga maquilingensis]ABW00868.1 thiamine biosynthesis/tRNA modification protein ThiI [Caldivirga maquilingensis IC-167]
MNLNPIVLVRYGEIGVKSNRVRVRLENLLTKNIQEALRRGGVLNYSISKTRGRILINVPKENLINTALMAARVFGVVSTSPAYSLNFSSINDIVIAAYELWRGKVNGRKFAVRVSRTGNHPFTSIDVAKRVGAVLYPFSNGVDLDNPEVELYVEIRDNYAFLFDEVIDGPGGLPLGSQGGKVLALVSGGFDSPVAYWLMSRRGALVDALFCSLAPPVDVIGLIRVIRYLYENWVFGYDPLIMIADCTQLVNAMRSSVNSHLMNTVFKKFLYRLAESIAVEGGYMGIVTGESLGQVSSQTLSNLYSASAGINVPIFRPLIGMDKDDIIKLAKRIGTYEESVKMIEPCSVFSRKPRTRSTPSRLDEELSRVINLLGVIKASIIKVKASELSSINERSLLSNWRINIMGTDAGGLGSCK